jgi:hypothetical protein
MAERALQWETVPAGARSSACRGESCGRQVYWIERKSRAKGKEHQTVRVPVDCDVVGGSAPDSMSDGKGINHHQNCVDAEDF